MRGEIFADILMILLISSVIAVILSLVNRAKRTTKKTPEGEDKKTVEEN